MRRLACLALLLAMPRPALADGKLQPWPQLTVTAPLADGVFVSGELVGRISADRTSQLEERLAVGVPATSRLTFWLGYAGITSNPPGPGPNGRENQIVEQASWTPIASGPVRLATRTRLEQRFIRGDDATSWRLREQLRVAIPFAGSRSSAVLTAEPYLALNRTARVRRTLDQLRLFAGVAVPVTQHVVIETGYLRQILYRATGTVANDAIPFVLKVDF